MPPFQPNATVPVPAPTAPSSTAPALALVIAAMHMVAGHVQPADVVEAAIVGFADQRVHRPDVLVARLRQRPPDDRLPSPSPTDSVLVSTIGDSIVPSSSTWVEPGELAERVADEHGARPPCRRKTLPPCGSTAVTPVRTLSP